MPQSALQILNEHRTAQRALCRQLDVKDNNLPSKNSASQQEDDVNVAYIAATMDVPVVIASFRSQMNLRTIATHGLDQGVNWEALAAICDELCREKVIMIPDVRNDPAIAGQAVQWPDNDNRFLVGMPLRDALGNCVGSICVMSNCKAVAKRGISFRFLGEVGKGFSETGRLG